VRNSYEKFSIVAGFNAFFRRNSRNGEDRNYGNRARYSGKNTVTMVDLGAKTCIPCKLMAPILEELEKEYKGRAAVIFIDVWENRDMSKAFRVVTIPTQIFYNKQGQEVYRHIGFFDKDSIKEKLDALIAE
jgi:thioredoxin 1